MSAKCLIIGYDGGTLDIIDPLVKEGRLPTFATLIENGVYGKLKSVFPPVSAPAWVSFMTGKNPGKHSVFNFTLKEFSTYYVKPATSANIDAITLYECLSHENKKVGIINVPLTFPPREVNGIWISGLGTPDEKSEFIYPDSFASEFRRAFPDYRIDIGWAGYNDEQIKEFLNDLNNLTQNTYEAAQYCIRKKDWDFFMVVFIGPDRVQHRLWNSIKAASICEKENTGMQSPYREEILNYFQLLDRYIGSLADECGNDSMCMILSDHGFGPFVNDIDLNNWLATEGLLRYSSTKNINNRSIAWHMKKMVRKLGISKRWVLDKLGKRIDVYRYLEKSNPQIRLIDWKKTKAFCYSSHFIYINLAGRERYGTVQKGKEYEDLRDEIISKLYKIRDPNTGRTVIKKVQRTEEIYNGGNLKLAADLIITEYDKAGYVGIDRVFQDEKDEKIFMKTTETQEGSHLIDGFLIAFGNNIKKGVKIEGANIVDIFPTLMYALDQRIPDDVDGKVLTGIFEKVSKEPRFFSKNPNEKLDYDLSEREKSKMVERLKELGYL